MGSFCPKYKMDELKNYRGIMCSDTEELWTIWREIDLSFQTWYEEFNKFWPEHSKISKIYTLRGCIWPEYIMFELKKYRRIMFDGTEDWWKIWRNLTRAFKNDIKNLANCHKLNNSDFILESKMAELNQNKNSKQPDPPDAMWKLYFTLEINE